MLVHGPGRYAAAINRFLPPPRRPCAAVAAGKRRSSPPGPVVSRPAAAADRSWPRGVCGRPSRLTRGRRVSARAVISATASDNGASSVAAAAARCPTGPVTRVTLRAPRRAGSDPARMTSLQRWAAASRTAEQPQPD